MNLLHREEKYKNVSEYVHDVHITSCVPLVQVTTLTWRTYALAQEDSSERGKDKSERVGDRDCETEVGLAEGVVVDNGSTEVEDQGQDVLPAREQVPVLGGGLGQPRGALDVLEALGAVLDEGVGESPAESDYWGWGGACVSCRCKKSCFFLVGSKLHWSQTALPRMNPMAFSGRTDEIELKVVMMLSGTISMTSLTDGSDIVKKKDGRLRMLCDLSCKCIDDP